MKDDIIQNELMEFREYVENNGENIIVNGDYGSDIVIIEYINNSSMVKREEYLENLCDNNNIKSNLRRIYYLNAESNIDLVVKDIIRSKPNIIISLGSITLRKIFKIKENYTNKIVESNVVRNVPIVSTISPFRVYLHPTERNTKIINKGFELAFKSLLNIKQHKSDLLNNDPDVIKHLNIVNKLNIQLKSLYDFKNTLQFTDIDNINKVNIKIDELLDERDKELENIELLLQGKRLRVSQLMLSFSNEHKIDAESEIILSSKQYKDFCSKYINNKTEVGFDVETNALPVMDVNHEIIGFSLASDGTYGCYVPLKALDFKMPEEDKNEIIEDLKKTLLEKEIWVYNCQHEIPVVYNNYGIFIKDVKDLYVIIKLLNCGKPWEAGSRTLKQQYCNKVNDVDWSQDLDLYFKLFKSLNKPEIQIEMKTLLSKYYEIDELDDILNKVIERYEDLKTILSSTKVLSYENVPYKLIGRYGSLDSSSLFELRECYYSEIEEKNALLDIDLMKGFDLWQKIHIAHVMMEMNGLYFNDKKAQKLDNWVEEQSIDIMKQILNSNLSRSWVKGNYWYEFSRNILMMNYVDEIIDREKYAKVVQGRNGITKDHIKLCKPTKQFFVTIRSINNIIEAFNNFISLGLEIQDDRSIYKALGTNIDSEKYMFLFRTMNEISRSKPFTKINVEYNKGDFIFKINWQNFLIFYLFSEFYSNDTEFMDREFDKWLKEQIDNSKTFEDYKALFNVNSTIKSFRDYLSNLLLSRPIKVAHTYYKLYEFTESATYLDDLEMLKGRNGKHMEYYDFMQDYETLMEETKGLEVFSSKRLEIFTNLFNKYVNDNFLNGLKYKRKLKSCFDWWFDDSGENITNYHKLSTLDAGMIEHLTQLYLMLDCNIDDRSTWTEEFKFMFNYKFIKKLIKAKSTYIDGSTGRGNAYYIDKRYYLNSLFPKRLSTYDLGNEINNVYDYDKAIEFELEDGNKVAFGPEDEVKLVDGTIKLAKDITQDDDIIIPEHIMANLNNNEDEEEE